MPGDRTAPGGRGMRIMRRSRLPQHVIGPGLTGVRLADWDAGAHLDVPTPVGVRA